MNIRELHKQQVATTDDKLSKAYSQLEELLDELRKRDLPATIEKAVNDSIDQINSSTLAGAQLVKFIKQKQAAIVKQVEKELKVVPKNYYRNLWMLFGFTAFGLPIGVAIALSLGNIGLLGIGLPFGMVMGLAVGASLDKKAFKEGRQLDVEVRY